MKVVFLLLDARDIDFHFDDIGVNSVNRGTQGLIEHRENQWAHEGGSADGRSCGHDTVPASLRSRCDGHHPVTVTEQDEMF